MFLCSFFSSFLLKESLLEFLNHHRFSFCFSFFLNHQRLEETFNHQLEEMEALYGASMIVPLSTSGTADSSRELAGSTRSSLSSYSEG